VEIVHSTASLQPVFYYDLGDPACYLVAERVLSELPVVPEWEPVLGSDLGIPATAWDREAIEQLAARQSVQSLRWPHTWPPDARRATLAATYAKHIGRAVAFSLACFRQVFAGGRDMGDEDTVLIAAAACEMHPTAVLKGIGLRSVSDALARAHERARVAGVEALPAIQVGATVFAGETCIEQATSRLGTVR
jgi:2-hydroxychromene-2-carboxylate isomerase